MNLSRTECRKLCFEVHLNCDTPLDLSNFDSNLHQTTQSNCHPPTNNKPQQHEPNGKPQTDWIPAEVVKLGRVEHESHIHNLITNCRKEENMPGKLRDDKSQNDKSVGSHYRGAPTLCPIYMPLRHELHTAVSHHCCRHYIQILHQYK